MARMIPIIAIHELPRPTANPCAAVVLVGLLAAIPGVAMPTPPAAPATGTPGGVATLAAPVAAALARTASPTTSDNCLVTGDGYLRARVAGAIDARIDWPNSGTQCQGETKSAPAGVRLSFKRAAGGKPDLLFVFGLTGIRRGQPAHATGANLTLIVQGTPQIFGTLGDTRCTVDSLSQTPLPTPGRYRVEARGFCTQPAHAVRGDGIVLISTFEFAGPVDYAVDQPPADAVKPRP